MPSLPPSGPPAPDGAGGAGIRRRVRKIRRRARGIRPGTPGLLATGILGIVAGVLAFGVAGCNYGFQAGGGLPAHIGSVAVLPFENETSRFELTQEVHQVLQREFPRALGVRTAGEDAADAVVRGRITGYDLSSPDYRQQTGQQRVEVLQREVTIRISVEVVDRRENVILWENGSLSTQGRYLEESETEEQGRLEAIELLVQRIVDGTQSTW